MITKFIESTFNHNKGRYKYVYNVHDLREDGEFGFIGMSHNGTVTFKLTEEKHLNLNEMKRLVEFMDELTKMDKGELIDTRSVEYHFKD